MGTKRRLVGCAGTVLVVAGLVCVAVLETGVGWPAAGSREDDPKHSPECQACLDDVHKTRASEREALAEEKDTCKRAERSCENNCADTDDDCFKQCAATLGASAVGVRAPHRGAMAACLCGRCKLAEHKCKQDSSDRHADHLTLKGMIDDKHSCRQVCKGLSSECELCIEEVHQTRAAARAALGKETEQCTVQEESCYERCEENDKQCRIECVPPLAMPLSPASLPSAWSPSRGRRSRSARPSPTTALQLQGCLPCLP